MSIRCFLCGALSVVVAACVPGNSWLRQSHAAVGGNWPGWRGDGTGISTEENLPVHWDAETNILWKRRLPGEGNSSPIVWGDRVFVTASAGKGKKRHVICLSARDGTIIWDKPLIAGRVVKSYPKSGYASPTPTTDGRRVYAFFDSPGLVALDMDGKVLWQRDPDPYSNPYNVAASPVVCGDTVILNCDHAGQSFIAAYDCSNGQPRWKRPRSAASHSATPLVITVDGRKQIVLNADTISAYESSSGETLWSCRGMKPYVTPSAVFDGALVYATSGRNGPSVAIDPRGRGDITETHVRLHFPIGGPYVPSPVVYPYLFLPGDNGRVRFVGPGGELLVKKRLPGHYTSSPVAGYGKIYWTSEKGDTYVLDVTGVQADRPHVEVLAINRLGDRVLASPAIANGRMYIRSDKHLFCIAGDERPQTAAAAQRDTHSFAELKKTYEDHQATEGEEVSLRLQVVDALAEHKSPEAVEFLKQVALKDNHWDVSEEAAKVLGVYGKAAEPALIVMLECHDPRPYLKIIAAGHAGRLRSAAATPALLKLARHRVPEVRIESLKALGEIAQARDADTAGISAALTAALSDKDGVVRRAAVDALARLAGKLGPKREAIIAALLDLAADRNKIVGERATKAMLRSFNVPREIVMKDEVLYGEQRRDSVTEILRAGPIDLKFQDGELRYLRVGDREIVRRVYLAVRDTRWDTVMPEFEKIDVQKGKDAFRITMAAVCRNDIADYRWQGQVVGTADGRITFEVSGSAGEAFKSPRVGICVLYGAESLAGQQYELVNEKGGVTAGHFPKLIQHALLAKIDSYRELRYTTDEGVEVSTALADGHFGMEDQRNFGDSSYKAFSGLTYKYPDVPKGVRATQMFVLEVRNAKQSAEPAGAVSIVIGEPVKAARIPKLLSAETSTGVAGMLAFLKHNQNQREHAAAKQITLPYNPAAHMPDDDTFMENIPAIYDQVSRIRSFVPNAVFRIDPITIDSPYPRSGPDSRNKGLFAAARCARMVKYLALAGVEEAVFTMGPGPAELVRNRLATYSGKGLLATNVGPHAALDALAIDDGGRRVVCLINKTNQPAGAVLEDLARTGKLHIRRLDASTSGWSTPDAVRAPAAKSGSLKLDLAPFAVCIITESD